MYLSKISIIASSTRDSLIDIPSFRALVLSLINKSTPSLPSLAILYKSAIGPIGVRSNLKSPVVTILPLVVVIHIPWESGIEWVVLINSTSICLNFNFVFSSYANKLSYLIFLSSNFNLINSLAWLGA